MASGSIEYTPDKLITEGERLTNEKIIRAIAGGRWRVGRGAIGNRELEGGIKLSPSPVIAANWTTNNVGLQGYNYFPFNMSSNRVADIFNNHLDLATDDDGVGMVLTFHRIRGNNRLRIRTSDTDSPPNKSIFSLDGTTVFASGSSKGFDISGSTRVVKLMYVGQANALALNSIDPDIRWMEIARY